MVCVVVGVVASGRCSVQCSVVVRVNCQWSLFIVVVSVVARLVASVVVSVEARFNCRWLM